MHRQPIIKKKIIKKYDLCFRKEESHEIFEIASAFCFGFDR